MQLMSYCSDQDNTQGCVPYNMNNPCIYDVFINGITPDNLLC